MRKGEKTKQHIIETTSLLLNQRGYLSTSMSEITKVTGLQKGGVYNYFRDKEELTIESFKYCYSIFIKRFEETDDPAGNSIDRLMNFIQLYFHLDIPGGCPIANAIVEAADVSKRLFEQAQEAMKDLVIRIQEMIATGISNKEIRAEVSPQKAAFVILSIIEGGLLMQKIFPGDSPLTTVQEQLSVYIQNELVLL